MAIIKHGRGVRTVGLDPHMAYPGLSLLALGIALGVLDKIGAIDLDDQIWITLIGSGGGVFGVGIPSPAPVVEPKADSRNVTPAR